MQHIRNSVLRHLRFSTKANELMKRDMCVLSNSISSDRLTARVIELVKNFDKMDASKVTETADFQKDLSLDSLDRVELVMAFEQEFSIEIPDDKADKLTCCADVVKYIQEAATPTTQNS